MERIGAGRTAEVFALDEDRVIKLFYRDFPLAGVEREAENAQRADALRMPSPRFYGRMCLDGRQGLIYERARGVSLMELYLRAQDEEARRNGIDQLARTHKEILGRELIGGRSLRRELWGQIDKSRALSPAQKARALRLLEQAPEGARACHGDFHPDNVMVQGERACVLDWANLAAGHPLMDIARTAFLLQFAALPPGLTAEEQARLAAMRRWGAEAYLRAMDVEPEQIEGLMTVMIAARTGEAAETATELLPILEERLKER